MNKSNLLEILSKNKEIDKADAHWLQEVINFYPYFAAASFALTKYYKQNQDFQFQQQLKTTATLTSDRKSLYNFINVSASNNINAEVLISTLPKPEISSIIEAKPLVIDDSGSNTIVEKIEADEPQINTEINTEEVIQDIEEVSEISLPENTINEEKIQEETQTLVQKVVEENDIKPVLIEPLVTIVTTENVDENINETGNETETPIIKVSEFNYNPLNLEVENKAKHSFEFDNKTVEHITLQQKVEYHESDDIELSHDEQAQIIESKTNVKVNVTEVLLGEQAITTQVTPEKKTEKNVENNVALDTEKKIPFNEIVSAIDAAPIANNVDLNILTNAIEKSVSVDELTNTNKQKNIPSEELSFTEWLQQRKFQEAEQKIEENKESKVQAEKPVIPSKIEKAKAEEILDKFIETQPRISKPKVEFYSPINMARQSVADTDELATETLATIYMAQSNYAKAIKVYETLMAKNPEKSTYYLKLIKKAKDRMQNKKN